MPWNQDSKREQQFAPWVLGVLAFIVIGIATYMNYGGSLHSHAAPAATTTTPAK